MADIPITFKEDPNKISLGDLEINRTTKDVISLDNNGFAMIAALKKLTESIDNLARRIK